MRSLKLFVSVLALAGAVGCAPTWRSEMSKRLDRESWTKEQKALAREYGYRYFGKELPDGTYVVLYSRLPTTLVRTQIESLMADIDAVLSYQNRGANEYLLWTGKRGHFLHQEEVFQAIYARIRLLELYGDFKKQVGSGTESPSRFIDEYGVDHREGYDPAILALSPDELKERFPFTSSFLEDAKKVGLLHKIGEHLVAEEREYAYREPDPDDPDDPQKFIWRTRKYQVAVLTYKVMDAGDGKPRNNFANYAEVYRVFDGTREPLPAVQAFFNGEGGQSLAVIDLQRQGEIGYGLPDDLRGLSEGDLSSDGLIETIFTRPKHEQNERIEPKLPAITVEIARIGQPVQMWERCDGSCVMPFKYRNDEKDNYSVELRYKKKEHGSQDRTSTLAFVEKHWRALQGGSGEVVEYFVPRSPFDRPALSIQGTTMGSGMYRIEFVFPDGAQESTVITPSSTRATGQEPRAIGYSWLGKRWFIEDTDGDGTFDRKRQLASADAEAPDDISK